MKKVFSIVAISILVMACKQQASKTKEITATEVSDTILTPDASSGDWIVLFDGTSFNSWHEYLSDSVSDAWKIEGKAMVFYPPKDKENRKSHNLVTSSEFTDFELSLEWKISAGGNSGIFWGVKELQTLPEAYQTGPEIQVLDNEQHPDAKNGTTHQAGSLYDMVAPTKDITKPVGAWNSCTIRINHKENLGSVTLNGEQIVVFPVNDPEWTNMVAKSKFANWEEFGKYTTGKIGLQDHSDKVSYRNIKIKAL